MGRFGGEHKSKRYGNTVDFADFREYHPGDDFRRIDYHVMARLDQVLIKLFEADDEITIGTVPPSSPRIVSRSQPSVWRNWSSSGRYIVYPPMPLPRRLHTLWWSSIRVERSPTARG